LGVIFLLFLLFFLDCYKVAFNNGFEGVVMGMYCACGIKKIDGWKCECDWDGWFICFNPELHQTTAPIKKMPDQEGKYLVRVFEDGDDEETESNFSLVAKNWGQSTNKAISHWEIEYNDEWTGYRGVYAWKKLKN